MPISTTTDEVAPTMRPVLANEPDEATSARELGVERGKIFPAEKARTLLNPLRRLIQSPRRTVNRLGLDPNDRVLELGPGPGYFSVELARTVPEGWVVLADVQPEMLRIARGRLTAGRSASAVSAVSDVSDVSDVYYVAADATDLPFSPVTFDAALVVAMLGEVPDQHRCIAELARVVRTGGRVLFAETRRDSDFIRLDALRRLVEPHGFDLTDRRGPPWEYTACFERNGESPGGT